jgi:hypothetical protein
MIMTARRSIIPMSLLVVGSGTGREEDHYQRETILPTLPQTASERTSGLMRGTKTVLHMPTRETETVLHTPMREKSTEEEASYKVATTRTTLLTGTMNPPTCHLQSGRDQDRPFRRETTPRILRSIGPTTTDEPSHLDQI